MEDKSLPQSIGPNVAKPVPFTEQDELCRRLDEFYETSGVELSVPPSSIFRGALYAMRREHSRENPDWMAQVAHSLREILYQFHGGNKRSIAFERYGSTYDEKRRTQDVGRYYNFITDVAHHNFAEASRSSLVGGGKDAPVTIGRKVFESVVFQFGKILYAVLRRQIDAHKEIDKILKQDVSGLDLAEVRDLIELNPDTRQYFYTKVNERWLDWLWGNGFLDVIKEKAEDPTRYGYRTPELNYLARISEKVPGRVVDFMLAIAVSAETFNPEVVDRFLWICSTLPAQQLARVVQKIRDEGWVPLMGTFNRWGLQYEKMLRALADAKDCKSVLAIAEAILAVRTEEEIESATNRIATRCPFYLDDLSYTKVFEHLANVGDDCAEQALALARKVMAKIVLLGDKAQRGEVFPIEETFHLFDVDFFALEPGREDRLSHRDDVRELVAVIKVLADRLIGERCAKADAVRKIYGQYIESLPESRTVWRLRLFVLSLCPKVFKDKLKGAFFRLFEVERYYEIMSGAEYEKALRKGFPALSENDKREYVTRVIEYFEKHAQDKKEQNLHMRSGSGVLSMITEHLTEEERQRIEKAGFELDRSYEPGPSIGRMRAGIVVPRGPVTQEEFDNLPIADIARKLRNEWTPEQLSKKNSSDDFLNPLNAEGAGELLRAGVPKRLQDYVSNADLFFKRGVLDQHYTYSFLRGIHGVLRGNKTDTSGINWDDLITLCTTIKASGEAEPFDRGQRERDSFNALLAGWNTVHSAVTDVIQELIDEEGRGISIDFPRYREQLLAIMSYLLSYPDPTPEDEKIESAGMKTKPSGSDEYLVSDPYTIAISTVRGRAFQAFVLFLYQDGKRFAIDESLRISSDLKELYERVLVNENTRALMFMFGYFLPAFYFRDKAWIQGLLPLVFPTDPAKIYLYIAAWEGYLSDSLYEEMFFNPDIQKLYQRGLALTDAEYPKQEHFREPDAGIATHIALAFVHYKDFGFVHALFDAFWKKNDPEQHAHFVSFLGRMFVSGSNANADELLKKEPRSKQQLKILWNWMLKNYDNTRPFVEFGSWISLEKEIFEPVWLAEHVKKTLEKTKGFLDSDYGLMKSVVHFSKEAPEDALAIARLYLLEGGVRGDERHRPLHVDNEWFEAFQVLYGNPSTKSETYILIDDLIREGGSTFWTLKEILDEANRKS